MLFTYVIQIMQYFLGKEKSFYRFHVTGRESKTKAIFLKVRDIVNSQEKMAPSILN